MAHFIELSREELELVHGVINARLSELEAELVGTDDRAFRQSLRDYMERLEDLRDKIISASARVKAA